MEVAVSRIGGVADDAATDMCVVDVLLGDGQSLVNRLPLHGEMGQVDHQTEVRNGLANLSRELHRQPIGADEGALVGRVVEGLQ